MSSEANNTQLSKVGNIAGLVGMVGIVLAAFGLLQGWAAGDARPFMGWLVGFGFWLSIPISALIGWVYVMMEIIGDYSENPFQGMANDIPMMSLCRVIEIDLREMLGETDLPPAVKAKGGVLM